VKTLALIALVTLSAAAEAQFSIAGPGDLIPAAGSGSSTGWDTANLDHDFTATNAPATSTVMVPVPVNCIDSITIIGLSHTWIGDLQAVLVDPNGVGWTIFLRPEIEVGETCCGNPGNFTFVDPGTSMNGPLPQTGDPAPGDYDQSWQSFDAVSNLVWPDGDENVFNVPLSGISGPAGAWTLNIYDWAAGDSGSFEIWMLNGNACTGGGLGTPYCSTAVNSTGGGALMSASGSTSVAANDLSLLATPCPPGEPGIFYYGPTSLAGIAFGDGFRCVGGPTGTVVRIFPFVVADTAGNMSTTINNTLPAHAQIVSGATLGFQAWFRDPAAAMSGFNLSNGLDVAFTP